MEDKDDGENEEKKISESNSLPVSADARGFDLSNDHSLLYSVNPTASGILRLRLQSFSFTEIHCIT